MQRIEILFEKFYNKTATEEERRELAILLGSTDDVTIGNLITLSGEALQTDDSIISEQKANNILNNILVQRGRTLETLPLIRPLHARGWFRMAAAAVVLAMVGLLLMQWLTSNNPSEAPTAKVVNDAMPGTTGATLKLDDGRIVELDSTGGGLIARQSGTEVNLRNGSLEYRADEASGISMNTLSTPRGKQFSVLLPDGSRVWLNAASSITFPSQFTGKERKVTVQGEAYFKVTKQASQPFVVKINNTMEVKVLGTEFNINSYEDEVGAAATLVSGAVELNHAEQRLVLRPGEQGIFYNNEIRQNKEPNIEEIVAWKEGNFFFDNSSLPSILRQFARWYDVEVIYESPVKNRSYMVMMSRQAPLSKVLQVMQAADIKFRIEGKKLYVQSY